MLYTDVRVGIRGWFAVLIDDDEDGMVESHPNAHKHKRAAERDAITWAETEKVPCKVRVEECRHTDKNCTCY
mgnify:CR=1 FL=1